MNLQSLNLAGMGPGEASLEEGHLSDTTASAPGSDDEVGSTAATDGSTLRTSPAEHGGSAGSESGGSAVDSVSGMCAAKNYQQIGKLRIYFFRSDFLLCNFILYLSVLVSCP